MSLPDGQPEPAPEPLPEPGPEPMPEPGPAPEPVPSGRAKPTSVFAPETLFSKIERVEFLILNRETKEQISVKPALVSHATHRNAA
jgi:hypothetical protein